MHTSPQSPGVLPDILGRATQLPVTHPRNGERLRDGHIFVAPPDCHLIVEPGVLRVTKGPKENRFRPAIDPLFRSAAQVYGPAAIGVVLTGSLDDGTAGLWAIKRLGGIAVAQDPADALYHSMPESAIRHVEVDHVVPVAALAPLLVRLTAKPRAEPECTTTPDEMEIEVNIARDDQDARDAGVARLGTPSLFACPECHGVLLQLKEGGRVRFRCHTGHAYSVDSLVAEISDATEESLWTAVRALEEAGILLEQMVEHARSTHGGADADLLAWRAGEAHRQASVVRELLRSREPLPSPAEP
jgi:two-component system chemotaxis response regulator CheB